MSFFEGSIEGTFEVKIHLMNVIYLTLIISTIVAIVFFVIFIFSLKRGQYDDTYTPSVRMLFEDELIKNDDLAPDKTPKKENISNNKSTTGKTEN